MVLNMRTNVFHINVLYNSEVLRSNRLSCSPPALLPLHGPGPRPVPRDAPGPSLPSSDFPLGVFPAFPRTD